jgi:hypothetical protein
MAAFAYTNHSRPIKMVNSSYLQEVNMPTTWNEAEIQRYIDDEEEESLTLDYKAADALAKSDGKKTEITKDVSAIANSAGGTIVYGLKEHPTERHKAGL